MTDLNPHVPLRRLVNCLDGRRVPLNAEQRSEMEGPYPYWGAGAVVDHIDSYLFDEEIVLLGEDGAPFFDTARDVAFWINEPVWVNNHIHVLRPTDAIDGRFLTYCLNVVDFGGYISGSTRDKLTQDEMSSIAVPVPPIHEQRRIADFLDDQVTRIDDTIAARRLQVEHVLARVNSAWADSVAEMLQGERAPLRRFVRGIEQGASPIAEDIAPERHDRGVVKTAAIKRGRFDSAESKTLSSDTDWRPAYRILSGDVLVARGSGSADLVGDSSVVDNLAGRSLMLSDLTYRLSGLVLDAWFVVAVLQSPPVKGLIRTAVRQGSGPAKIRGEDLLDLPMPVIAPPEQKTVAAEYWRQREQADSLVARLKTSVVLLEERKRSLITAAVTGEFDLSTASARAAGV